MPGDAQVWTDLELTHRQACGVGGPIVGEGTGKLIDGSSLNLEAPRRREHEGIIRVHTCTSKPDTVSASQPTTSCSSIQEAFIVCDED